MKPSSPAARERLGDFTADRRIILLSVVASAIGVAASFIALALLRLIGLFTNLFYFGRWRADLVSPSGSHLGWIAVGVPVLGALVIGLMARYGSERIRGHGIPEAIESILISGSRVDPRLTVLKPLSAAVSIGSGGPFGAEGPIIMTGGAFGSLVAQFGHLSSHERKTLLVAGAAAGMSATFAAPIAATLLAVELLLFEWKPRSAVPVALASGVAALTRHYLLGPGPLFPAPAHPAFVGPAALGACVLIGLLAGGLSSLLTLSVYASEDAFSRLRLHWMWWPAIGGLVVGLGGLVDPRALGVGYDSIRALVQGTGSTPGVLGLLAVKWIIWAVALGSGTSGGVLAPLLLMGGSLGALCAPLLPHVGPGFWPIIGIGAILGGTMRAPFTGMVFAFELTHDASALLPLLAASFVAHGVTVLLLKRSILTEKVARRGYHLSREYSVDPLEILFVRDVMRTRIVALEAGLALAAVAPKLRDGQSRGQRLLPVVRTDGRLAGVVTRHALRAAIGPSSPDGRTIASVARADPVVAYPGEPLRLVVNRMAQTGLTRFPVVESPDSRALLGMVSLEDLLKARARHLEEEHRREQVLPLRIFLPQFPRRGAPARSPGTERPVPPR